MSIYSKVHLEGARDNFICLEINADLVHLSEADWTFVKEVVDALRKYERERNNRENARKDMGVTR